MKGLGQRITFGKEYDNEGCGPGDSSNFGPLTLGLALTDGMSGIWFLVPRQIRRVRSYW